ncbi:C25 family cysteine peptidase [Kocuria sp. CPCC 205258]|uniref:C25 family cysteine peptidase n=1 Tax=Kocuria sp. CPCC 205258 TaxID=3073552 RepID=UPI0034D50182
MVLPETGTRTRDPFRLRERIAGTDADAFVLVTPRRWRPYRSVPAPAIDGRAVALVRADVPADLPVPGPPAAAEAPWVVSAMAKDVFLGPAGRWADTLTRAGCSVADLRADRARREDLVAALRSGPSVVLYAGHGRPRGWGGYQGVRWNHVDPASAGRGRPAGLVVAFACDTLKGSRSGVPFGNRVVEGGVAGAYLGAARALQTAEAEDLADIVVGLLATGTGPTAAHLVAAVDHEVRGNPGAARAWRQFRLVGDPFVSLERTVGERHGAQAHG